MYAVMQTGGKQYRVTKGEYFRVETLDLEDGAEVQFNALMIGDGDNIQIGRPFVEGGLVKAVVKSSGRGKKIEIIKFRRRKHYMKRMGHRQNYTEIEITEIVTAQSI